MAYAHIDKATADSMASRLLSGEAARSDLASELDLKAPEVSMVLRKFGLLEAVKGTRLTGKHAGLEQHQFKRDPHNAKTKLYDQAIQRVMAGESAYKVQKSLPEINYQYLTRLVKKHRDETEKSAREH
jgi:hypothetical protein